MKRLKVITLIILGYLLIFVIAIASIYLFRQTMGLSFVVGIALSFLLIFCLKMYYGTSLDNFKSKVYQDHRLASINKQLSIFFTNSLRKHFFSIDREGFGYRRITDEGFLEVLNNNAEKHQLSIFNTVYYGNKHKDLKATGFLFEYQHLLEELNVSIKRLVDGYKPKWVYIENDKTIKCKNFMISNVLYSVGASNHNYDISKMESLLYSIEELYGGYKHGTPFLNFEIRIVKGLLYVLVPTDLALSHDKLYFYDLYTEKGESYIKSQYYKVKSLNDSLFELFQKEKLKMLFGV